MRPLIATMLGVLSFALGFGSHLILAHPDPVSMSTVVAPASASCGDLTVLTQRLDRIESSLDALHSTVFLAGTSEGTGAAAKLSAESLVAALRDELRRQAPVAGTAEHPVDDAAVEAEPENAPALAEAERTFEAARSAGRWTDEDAQSLRQSLASLSGRQATDLLDRLVPAFNRGEIKVVTNGPAF